MVHLPRLNAEASGSHQPEEMCLSGQAQILHSPREISQLINDELLYHKEPGLVRGESEVKTPQTAVHSLHCKPLDFSPRCAEASAQARGSDYDTVM